MRQQRFSCWIDVRQVRGTRDRSDYHSSRATHLLLLIGAEAKQLVLDDRYASDNSEVVVALNRGVSRPIEIRTRVQFVVAKVFKQRAMELVGSAFGQNLYLRARVPAILGVEVVTDHVELFDPFERHSAQTGTSGGGDIRRRGVIESDVIAATATAVGIKAAQPEKRVVWRDRDDPWYGGCQREHASRRDGEFHDLLRFGRALQLRINCIELCCGVRHDHLLLGSFDFERNRHRGYRPATHRSRRLKRCESSRLDLDAIGADTQLRETRRTIAASNYCSSASCFLAG